MKTEKNLPLVYIIILNWNGYDDTRECIYSLFKISYKNYKIIIVDNGSEDDSCLRLKNDFGNDIKFIENEVNLGFTGGNNVGIKYALKNEADYILLLNNDTIVDSNFLSEFLHTASSDEGIGILGPKIYYFSEPDVIWFSGGVFNQIKCGLVVDGMGKKDDGRFDEVLDVDFISGCSMLIKTEVFRKIGLLNEEYFNYAEDADFCSRAKKSGYRVVYVPKAKLWHKIAKAMKGNFAPFYLYFQSKNRLLYIKNNFSKVCLIYGIFIHIFCYIPYKLLLIWFNEKRKLKASCSLLIGTFDFFTGFKEPRFFK